MASAPRIALLTSDDPADRRAWSGSLHGIYRSLERHCGDVQPLGPVRVEATESRPLVERTVDRWLGRRFDHLHGLSLGRAYGRHFSAALREGGFDLVVAVAASTETAFVETAIPIHAVGDTTFARMLDYNPYFTGLSPRSVREGLEIERRAIAKATSLLYASEWAARSAIEDFGADPRRVHVVPFGANLEDVPDRERVLARRNGSACRLLFVGVDWGLKGGAVAVETLDSLIGAGIDADLTVCGCVPPLEHPRMTVVPFLDKNVPEQRAAFDELLARSDFLVLPTRSECFGIAFCEASAYGLPSFGTATGGVSSAVRDGVNGFLLPAEARGSDYASRIRALWEDPERLVALRASARDRFGSTLNWDAWGRAMAGVLSEERDRITRV